MPPLAALVSCSAARYAEPAAHPKSAASDSSMRSTPGAHSRARPNAQGQLTLPNSRRSSPLRNGRRCSRRLLLFTALTWCLYVAGGHLPPHTGHHE